MTELLVGFHYPKGFMCIACKDVLANCSNLNFKAMPLVNKKLNTEEVICKNFKHNKEQTND